MLHQPLHGQLKRLANDRWAWRGIRTLLRFAWIGMSLLCIGLGGHLLFGWPLRFELLGLLVIACTGVGVLLLLKPPMSPAATARRLDRRFRLNNQLATALEVDAQDAAEGVAARLLDQSQRTISRVQRYVASHQRFPWSEVITLIAFVLLGLGLLLMIGLGLPDLFTTPDPLPALAVPDQTTREFPPDLLDDPDQSSTGNPGTDQQGQSDSGMADAGGGSGAGQAAALAALADALRDQSATRPAATALDQGNTAQAAQELRALADQANQLSATTRQDLAQRLREAANEIGRDNPELANQIRQQADGLEQGGQNAAQALENLATLTEQMGSQRSTQEGDADDQGQSGSPQSGAGAGAGNIAGDQREQSVPSDRLGVEGVPLDLESEGAGTTPASASGDSAATSSATGSFLPPTGSLDTSEVRTGDDPLRIPLDLRDVVQDYFSPTQ